MARVKKIDNAILKRLRRAEERDKRKEETKEERKYYLLFCEGARTEPNYFLSIKSKLPKNVVELDIDPAGGKNTISLVTHAIQTLPAYQKKNPTINFEVWIVFDKDSFPNSNFDNAINMASANQFKCAYSNEAFELWYLLHFEYYNTGISRKQYGKLLTKHLKVKYEKNDAGIYKLLQENENSSQEAAIERAKKLEKNHLGSTPSSSNPVTTVYKLVEELNKFIE